MNEIRIDRITEGYLVHYKGIDGIQDISYKVWKNPDGLNDGLLDLLAEIKEFLDGGDSKHDKVRPFIGYQTSACSKKERTELQKKTDWEII